MSWTVPKSDEIEETEKPTSKGWTVPKSDEITEGEQEPKKDDGGLMAGGREMVRSVIPGAAGVLGGMWAGGVAGLAGGPFAEVTVPVAALAGGIAAGMGTRKGQDVVADKVAPDSFMGTKQAQADAEAHPVASFAGSLLGMGKPSASALSGGIKAFGTQAGRQGIATIVKQMGNKELREQAEAAAKKTLAGTETLTPEAIAAAKAQKAAAEHFGHAIGAGAGVGAMTGIGIAQGEDPLTATAKGVAGLAVRPWAGPGGVLYDPLKGKFGAGKTETSTETEEKPEPLATDTGIENLADELLGDPDTTQTGEALAEFAKIPEKSKTGADVENPLEPAFSEDKSEVSSTTPETTDNPDVSSGSSAGEPLQPPVSDAGDQSAAEPIADQVPLTPEAETEGALAGQDEVESREIRGKKAADLAQGRGIPEYVENRPLAQLWLNKERVVSGTGEKLPSLQDVFKRAVADGNQEVLQDLYWEMAGARRSTGANDTFRRMVEKSYRDLTGEDPLGVDQIQNLAASRPELLKNRSAFDFGKYMTESATPKEKPAEPFIDDSIEPPEEAVVETPVTEQPVTEQQDNTDTAPVINATDKAIERAMKLKVNLDEVRPKKEGAKVTVADVQRHFNESQKNPAVTESEPAKAEKKKPNYWYRDEESQEFFEDFDSEKAKLDTENDPKKREKIQKRLLELKQLYAENPDDYFRLDLNNPLARSYDEAGIPTKEELVSLAGAKWVDTDNLQRGNMVLRRVLLPNGKVEFIDLTKVPEVVRDQITDDTPVLDTNFSELSRVTGVTRTTLAKWAQEKGMPTAPELAKAWIENHLKEKADAAEAAKSKKAATSLNASVGDSTTETIGSTYVGENPSQVTAEANSSNVAIVDRALAHMKRKDVPIARRLAVGELLKSESFDLNMTDEEYTRLDNAINELRATLETPEDAEKSAAAKKAAFDENGEEVKQTEETPLEKADREVAELQQQGLTSDQLMDDVDGQGKFEVSPLRSVGAGSQGDRTTRGEPVATSHAADLLDQVYRDSSANTFTRAVAGFLKRSQERLAKIPVNFFEQLEPGVFGEMDRKTMSIALPKEYSPEVALHEILHALTQGGGFHSAEIKRLFLKIRAEAVKRGLTSEEDWTRAADPEALNKTGDDEFHYAFSSHDELIAGLLNPKVRKVLNSIPMRDEVTGVLSNAWELLKLKFLRFLKFEVKQGSALDKYLSHVMELAGPEVSSEELASEKSALDTDGGNSVLYANGNKNLKEPSEQARLLSERLRQRREGNQGISGSNPGGESSDLQNAIRVTERIAGRDSSKFNRGWAEAGLESLRSLEDWADKNGKVLDGNKILAELRSDRAIEEGSEHTVVRTKDGKRVIKVTHDDPLGTGVVGQSANVNDYLKGLEYQNILFGDETPESRFTFDGITYLDEAEGRPQLVISQPYVGGKKATEAQITKFFKDRGYVKKDGYWIGTEKDGYQYTIGDAVPDNVKAFKDSSGKTIVYPIDVQVSREPVANAGKLRAIGAGTTQKPKTTRALEKYLLTADPEVRAKMAGKTYITESFRQWTDNAKNWITSRAQQGDSTQDIARILQAGGSIPGLSTEQEAITAKYIVAQQAKVLKWALEKQIKTNGGVKTSVEQSLLDQYTSVGNQLTRDLSERATLSGKIQAAFRMIAGNLNKNYVIDEYVSPLFKAQQEKLAEKKDVQALRREIEKAIKNGGETTVERAKNVIRRMFNKPTENGDGATQAAFDFFDEVKLPDNSSPSKIAIPIAEQYANAASKALTKYVAGSISKQAGNLEGPALKAVQDSVRKAITNRMREILKGVEETPDYDREAAVSQLARELDLADLSEKAFNQSVQDTLAMGDKAKITPKQREALEKATYDGGSMKSAQDILRREVKFRDVVKQTLTSRTADRETLIGDIVENSGISRDQAEKVADALRQTYEFEAQKAAKKQLEDLIKNKATREERSKVKQVKEHDIQKLMKLTNMGAFSEERFYNAIADSYKLPTWDAVFAKQLEKEAEEVQNLPEGDYKNQRTGDILNKIATKYTESALTNWKSKEGINKILDLTTAAWQAGVLSGPPTQLVNLIGSHASVVSDSVFEALGYAMKTGNTAYFSDALGTIYKSLVGKQGLQEINRALGEGTTKYRVSNLEGASQLENIDPSNLKGVAKGLATYAGKLKYVGRAMMALDAVNMNSADMAKQKMATRFFLEHSQGKSKEKVNEILNDLFYPDKAVTDSLRATAEKEAAEGMYGDNKNEQKKWIERRISELKQKRREEIYEGITDQGKGFAEHATYNDQATGLLGRFVAGTASQLNAELKVSKFVLSFMNTLSNIVNQSLDYTLWGSLRAANMSPSQIRFARNSKYAPRLFQEGSPEQAAQYAKSILGTTALMSLAYMAWKGLEDEQAGKEPFFSIHGNGPQNSMDKQQLLATQKWQPNSVKVGGSWYRYVDWPVLGVALGGIGAAYDAFRYKKDEQTTGELIQLAAMASVSTVLQKNMLQGITTFIDAINGKNPGMQKTSMARLTSGIVAGYTNPGLLRWARNTFGMDKNGQVARLDQGTTEGWLASMTPASIGYNTPALNTLGEPITQPWYSATTWRFTNNSNLPPHPIITPIVKAGLMLPNPSKATEFRFMGKEGEIVKGKMGKYPEIFRRFTQVRGELMKESLTPQMLTSLAEYSKEDKNKAQTYLDNKIGARARDMAVKMIEQEISDGKLALR